MFERLDIYRQAMDQAYNSVMITTADLDRPGPAIVYVNRAFCIMTGYSPEEVIGATPRMLQGPRTDPSVLQRLRRTLSAGEAFQASTVNYRKDGTPYLVEWNISPVRDEEDRVEYFLSVQRDITSRAEAEQFNQTLLNSLGEGVFGINAEGAFTFVNPAALRLLGYDREEELLGENSHQLTHHTDTEGQPYPEEACPIYQVMQTGEPLEAWQDVFWRRDGSRFPVETYATPLWRDLGTVFGGVVVFRDISEQKRLERELEQQATHDRLTGLYNRGFFDQVLDKEIGRAARYGHPLSLILLDIDHFKAINDTYGHLVGDEILKGLAARMARRLRESDTLARWGGEEFIALLPATQATGARELAEGIRRQVAEEAFPDVGHITISLGVAELEPGESLKDLTRRTDDALYAAKSAGRDQVRTA
ncbi:MAG: sensor domain-containing diguanylate cyclase [Pseudomonadota bacterium]